MTTEDSMRDEHLAIAFEANRQLRLDVQRLARELDEASSNCTMYKQQLRDMAAEVGSLENQLTSLWHKLNGLARIIAETFADCYASSYLRGDEVAKIIVRRFGGK